jgi:rhamnulokinase
MSKRVLAFDFGASSGRAILGDYSGGKIRLTEIHRFSNDPVSVRGTLYWDVLRLFHEVKQGILKAVHAGGFDAIGIDTWGVDFGLVDKEGRLLSNPVHYRDERTEGMMEEVFKLVPRQALYQATGTQLMRINTLFQLMAVKQKDPELWQRADQMLLMPDLLAYFLTGVRRAEYTEVSTTNMLNPNTGDWAREILDQLAIPQRLLPSMIDAGQVYGNLSPEICQELGCPQVPVIAVATHDTGSAVVAVPATEDDFIYISCGTWSLFGTELAHPVINDKTAAYNFTNEGGYGRTTRLLKNIMGLWLTQEAKRQWEREGQTCSFGQLADEAQQAEPFTALVDPDDAAFELPGDLPARMRAFCKATGQPIPQGRGEVMRTIYESLALKYRYTHRALEEITGRRYGAIHMIGGGTQAKLLCQMTADACGVPVIAGPVEATAMGNVAVQLIALGQIDSLKQARAVVAASETPALYEPVDTAAYDRVYDEFLKILNR